MVTTGIGHQLHGSANLSRFKIKNASYVFWLSTLSHCHKNERAYKIITVSLGCLQYFGSVNGNNGWEPSSRPNQHFSKPEKQNDNLHGFLLNHADRYRER